MFDQDQFFPSAIVKLFRFYGYKSQAMVKATPKRSYCQLDSQIVDNSHFIAFHMMEHQQAPTEHAVISSSSARNISSGYLFYISQTCCCTSRHSVPL